MKYYIPSEGKYKEVFHNGNHPTEPLFPFIVNCQRPGFSRDYLIFAPDANRAIENFKKNIELLIEEIRNLTHPKNLLPRKIMVNPHCDKIDELRTLLRTQLSTLQELEDEDNYLKELQRESLRQTIQATKDELIQMETNEEEQIIPSKFEEQVHFIKQLTQMTLTAQKLDINRAYSLSYFDDSRDYIRN